MVPLSANDRALLTALLNPDAPIEQLNPADLAPFLALPEIQEALNTLESLRELRLRVKLAAAAERAIETLDHINQSAQDPLEARRASTTLLRLYSRLSP